MSLSWKEVYIVKSFTLECPIMGGMFPVEEFNEMYRDFLITLDGHKKQYFVTYYYQRSPINDSHWEFINETMKKKFFEKCQKKGVLPDLKQFQAGEWDGENVYKEIVEGDDDKAFDEMAEWSGGDEWIEVVSIEIKEGKIKKEKVVLTEEEKLAKVQQARLDSLNKLKDSLVKEENPEKRANLEKKIQKIESQLT